MSRTHNDLARKIIEHLHKQSVGSLGDLYEEFSRVPKKELYDSLYRLKLQGYVDIKKVGKEKVVSLNGDGSVLALQQNPVRDGVWKLIIFDIPEKKRKVRDHLRSRLLALGFKKWQTSIWASPYMLPKEIEEELLQLSEKLFVRLIKTTDINNTTDLEKLFGSENEERRITNRE